MGKFTINGQPQPFPEVRPELRIEPLDQAAPELHWREVRNYFSALEVGDHTMWAIYDQPDWRFHNFTDQRMVGRITVHGVQGLEMRVVDYEEETNWTPYHHTTFIGVRDDVGQWLGTLARCGDERVLRTFLDEDFDEDWGRYALTLHDTGRFAWGPDGSLVQRHGLEYQSDNAGIVGMVRLGVGEREFDCVHVVDVPVQPTEQDLLMESFVRPEDGRLIACRRYNGRLMPFVSRGPWDEELPHARRLVVDGVTFIHWYDCLGHIAVGVEPEGYGS